MMRNVLLAACAGGVLFLAACGGGGGEGGSGGTGNGGSSSTGTSTLPCTESLTQAPNSEYCAGSKTTPNCELVTPSYHNQVCGVPVLDPPGPLSRSADVEEYAGSGPPDLGCFAPGSYPTAGASQTVTLEGVVKIFSHGCESKNVTIEVYEVVDADIGSTPVGTPVTTASDCTVNGVASTNDDCGTRYECKYSYPGVPSEKELLVLTKGDLWAPLYSYNLYIPNDQVQGGKYTHEVRALATDDYSVIPQAAIGGPITPGNGAIAGEVHDCGDVRLIGAKVDVDVSKRIVTYFTSDEDKPLPDLGATGTSALGLYAALDVPPGKASVAALGLVDGKITTVGYHRVKVFPDAVTSITFRGVRPFQVSQ
ncbi:Hypothetical protein A7982_00578 [Minicystis rosea]|nr:Hypothetical protein A7982_00578 [Minicystis rosea]